MQPIDLTEIQARIEARQGVSAPTSPETGRHALPQSLVETVWQLMGSMYGHRWTSSFGDSVDPDRVWAATLAGLNEAQVRYGMRQCVAQGHEWPPSAPEFRKLCTGTSDVSWEHKRVEAADRERASRTLTHQPSADERKRIARQHMDQIRRTLGMPPGELQA